MHSQHRKNFNFLERKQASFSRLIKVWEGVDARLQNVFAELHDRSQSKTDIVNTFRTPHLAVDKFPTWLSWAARLKGA
jgi:hypothetical protein